MGKYKNCILGNIGNLKSIFNKNIFIVFLCSIFRLNKNIIKIWYKLRY